MSWWLAALVHLISNNDGDNCHGDGDGEGDIGDADRKPHRLLSI